MEKSYVWYPVYKKLPDTNRNVIIQCEELEEPTIGYFNCVTREWVVAEAELCQEIQNGTEISIVAWMEMPPRYMDNKALEFRTAAETRYFMSVSASRDANAEIANFYKVRNAIYYAAQKGLDSCEVQITNMSEELARKLKNGGYKVKNTEDIYTISWT